MLRKFFLLLAILGVNELEAQSIERKWVSLSYEAFESRQASLNFRQRFRWREGDFHQWITEIDYNTRLNNSFIAGLELRYISENDNQGRVQGTRPNGRIRFNLTHESKLGIFELNNRAGIQYQRRFDDQNEKLVFRFKPEITPKIKNFAHDPSFSLEYFQNLGVGADYSMRMGLSIPFKFDRNRFEIRYFYETFNLQSIEAQHILSLGYKFGQ